MKSEEVNIVDRIGRVALVNAIAGTVAVDIQSKLRSFVEEDEISRMKNIQGYVRAYAADEILAGHLFIVITRGTISNADTSTDSDGTDATKTLDEMCSDEYVAIQIGRFFPESDINSAIAKFSYKPSKKDAKAFVSDGAKTANVNIALVAILISHSGTLGAHDILVNYKMNYHQGQRSPSDIMFG
jgi:hypothetical protein